MRIAVIGAGISGLSAAWLLSKTHAVKLFEAAGRAGGHSNTVDAPTREGLIAVDTGFIVYNEQAYPNLTAFFAHLKVETAPSSMTFGASLFGGAYEYAGGQGASGFFGQKRNWLNPGHWRLLADVLRFTKHAAAKAESLGEDVSLGEFLARENYGAAFIDRHILPMGAAIWSTPAAKMLDYPARSFIRFFANHGLLRVTGHPPWRTVKGGSREYVKAALADAKLDLKLKSRVLAVRRHDLGVEITTASGTADFDRVLIATHTDQALGMLADVTSAERHVLADLAYCPNEAVLHTDKRLMPKRKSVWASWNFIESGPENPVTVTYWMNLLQGIDEKYPLFVSLNPKRAISEELIFDVCEFDHPVFDTAAIAAQHRIAALQGRRGTWFAGAHLGHGFHEDGLSSAVRMARGLGAAIPWEAGTYSPAADAAQQKPSALPHFPPASLVPAELF